ncbi:MAG: hypothetical protein ACYDBJ_18000 [Aggregatilineales bacterium]
MSAATQANTQHLDHWVAQFDVRQAASRQLWKAIYAEFERQKPPMTVRQMFYRMSSTGEVPKTEAGYRQVQRALTVMRAKGAIPFEYLADNTRWVRQPRTFGSLTAMLTQSQQFYRRAVWDNQPQYVEIWLEKDALAGVITPITSRWDVPLYVTRGYPSLSYLHNAAEALRCIQKPIYIYHFGDYDASGKDAARSIRDGLHRFGATFHFEEIAVTADQIDTMQLQTRPAKKTDPRAGNWGNVAVEVDAIEPATLRTMVDECIQQHVDQYQYAALLSVEKSERATLASLISDFGSRYEVDGDE